MIHAIFNSIVYNYSIKTFGAFKSTKKRKVVGGIKRVAGVSEATNKWMGTEIYQQIYVGIVVRKMGGHLSLFVRISPKNGWAYAPRAQPAPTPLDYNKTN
jgi:hypothetical protein